MPQQVEEVVRSPSFEEESERSPKRPARGLLASILVVLAALAVSSHTIGFDFVLYDDDYLVYANPLIRDLANIPMMFDPTADRSAMGSEYLPLTTLSFAIDYALYGNDPQGFHTTNVILYAIFCLTFYLVLRSLVPSVWAAVAGTLLCVVHPLHTETFAWIAERKSLLNGIFALFSFYAYLQFRRRDRKAPWYFLSLLSYLLAFMSKYTAISMPAVFLAYDLLFLRKNHKLSLRQFAPLLPFLAASFGLISLVVPIGLNHDVVKVREDPFWIVLLNDPAIVLYYLKLLVYPVKQCAFYLWPVRQHWTLAALVGCGAIVALLALAWVVRKKMPGVTFSILWFFALLLPILNFFPKGVYLAERYLFLSSLALSMAVAWLWVYCREVTRRRPLRQVFLLTLFAGLLGSYTMLTYSRADTWRNSFTLWETTLEHSMANPAAYDQLGLAHLTLRRDPVAAREAFKRGLEDMDRRNTPHAGLAVELRFHLVLSYLEGKRVDDARREWQQLERICLESGDEANTRRLAGWEADMTRHYPELFRT